jgi:hypothetical protein
MGEIEAGEEDLLTTPLYMKIFTGFNFGYTT